MPLFGLPLYGLPLLGLPFSDRRLLDRRLLERHWAGRSTHKDSHLVRPEAQAAQQIILSICDDEASGGALRARNVDDAVWRVEHGEAPTRR